MQTLEFPITNCFPPPIIIPSRSKFLSGDLTKEINEVLRYSLKNLHVKMLLK